MNIVLIIIAMTLAFVAGVFSCLKSVQLGLRWKIQAENKQEPVMTIPNPIQPIIEHKEQKEAKSIFNEWVNGGDE
jgi:hypothetical protein